MPAPLKISSAQRDQMASAGCGTEKCPYAEAKAKGLTWVEIELTNVDGSPSAGQAYRITCPDGSTRAGSLDGKGWAGHYDLEPGDSGLCTVEFPGISRSEWDER